ncbi:PLP-dependent cysteine synthase family protein [Halopiger aswanensis]|uniref:Cystathionine beta-synthase/cysteine synthase A n=1 Tax=Halopiger aswanensis TaxID=148449 RepID=A0A3R7GYM1_9EURY|nr:cysteine synthase family protein [Halopiger aswanensis]RKD98071.1 cystathionine beta-synthase/cysteine synthase A [Halopiger aswanensis]
MTDDSDRSADENSVADGGYLEREEPKAETHGSPYQTGDPVLARIGETPLVDYPEPADGGDILLKLEADNPTGSMKDRVALGMIRELEAKGRLEEDDVVVEASSGNTAGAVALVTNRLGYESVLTVPEGTSGQKIGYVRAFGSEIVECPDVDSGDERHYRSTAERIASERGGVWLDQYSTQLNPTVHYEWTGPELWRQAAGDLTHVVCPMGTGGTLSGIARYVKERTGDVEIVGVDAEQSNISAAFYDRDPGTYDTDVEGLGKEHELPTMWFDYIDEVRSVADQHAFDEARRAAAEHGVLVGGSSGAAIAVAREIADEQPNARIAVIGCDGGEQYFDTVFDEASMSHDGSSGSTLE